MQAGRSKKRRGMERVAALALAFGVFVLPLAVGAQQGGRVYRIGMLREGPDPLPTSFMDAMRALGWLEGQNLKIERRNADGRDQLPALAADLVRLKVDLIVTAGTPATRAAKEATNVIPIVFNLAIDPVECGLVASFARPGGNLTGFAFGVYDDKCLEVLKEALPRVRRVAYPAPVEVPRERFTRLNAAARALDIKIQGIPLQGPNEFDDFFSGARRAGARAVLVENIAWFRPHLKRLGASSVKNRLPAIGYDRPFAESGGLLSYGPALQNAMRLATQVDRILKGAKPADLPVEQPIKFDLVINLNTAKALGLTIPQSLLLRADQVIE